MQVHPRLVTGVALAVLCAAIGWSRSAAAQAHDAPVAQRVCPMDVPNTTVFAVEVDEGTGLAFVTTSHVNQLRARVRALSVLHNRGAGDGPVASVEPIENGVILAFRPGRPGTVDEVAGLLAHVERLAGADCPMARDESAVVPVRRLRFVPTTAPLPGTTVPGVSAGPGVSSFLTSIPAGIGF